LDLSVRGATTLFEVPFASAMSDVDLAVLERTLNLSVRRQTRPDSPGFTRLDRDSGLFLEPRVGEGQWMLQARTWGRPPPESVHEWHVVAAGGARQLDPTVVAPERLSASSSAIPDRPLGRAANKRLSRIRRRMGGLSG
jgi:hypothetical protein